MPDDNPPRRPRRFQRYERPPGRAIPAFDLRDREPDMGVLSRPGQDYVITGYLINYDEDPGRRVPIAISFNAGDDEDEFWDNYYEALRQAMKDAWGDDSPAGGVWLTGVAAA